MTRNFSFRRAACGAVVGILVAALLAACGESGGGAPSSGAGAAGPPGPVDAEPGATVEREGVTVVFHEVGAAYSFGNFDNAEEGFFFISALFTVRNTGSGSLDLGIESMTLETSGGGRGELRQAAPAVRLAGAGPSPGEETRGWRSWEVPNGTTAATISYKPRPDLEIRFGFTVPDEIRDRWRV